jgi:fumarylacetoacetase
MIAHHSSSGCGLATGDLIGTGTLSAGGHSEEKPTLACLHELTKAGTRPIVLRSRGAPHAARELTWLSDGDEVVFTGWAGGAEGRNSKKRMGFGELRGKIVECRGLERTGR